MPGIAYPWAMTRDRILDGRLKLRHLTLAVTIADQGSVVGAAKALHVTQPVVSRGLHEVEAILGVALFDRGPRGVTPTIYGEAFLTHANAVLAQLREADSQIELLKRGEIGRVRVGTHLAGSNLLLPRAIARLKREHPRLTVIVREATPDLLQNLLLAGDLDLTIGRLSAEAAPHLRHQLLHLEPIRLVARIDHPVHARSRPTLGMLARYPWIFPLEQTALRAELEETFVTAGVEIPENRIECTSILTMHQILITTDTIAALPQLIATEDDKLRPIEANLASLRRSVGVTLPADRPLSPATQVLLGHLESVAADLG